MADYDQMDDSTSAAFDIFFSGIIPIGYSIYFDPLLSTTLKSKIEDLMLFIVEPLIPLFYAFNKITYNEFTNKHLVYVCIYISFRIVSLIIYYSIFIWVKKTKKYFRYKSFKHCILFLYFVVIEYFARFVPIPFLESSLKFGTGISNGVALFGIIFAFFAYVFMLPYILFKNRRNFPIFGNIIYSIYTFSSFYISIVYLVIIPSNVIYVKIAFNINLLLVMRFFTIANDKPSNKNKSLSSVILFAFDDIEDMKKELKREEKDQYWYMVFLSYPIIKRIFDEIMKRILKKIDKENDYYEDELNCNKANILYYYKYGEALEKKRNKKHSQNIAGIGNYTYDEFVLETYIPGINLHNEIKKANKIYKLFNGIGVQKIDNVESFSASDFARLEFEEIEDIINNLNRLP